MLSLVEFVVCVFGIELSVDTVVDSDIAEVENVEDENKTEEHGDDKDDGRELSLDTDCS